MTQIQGIIGNADSHAATAASLVKNSSGIPLTGSMQPNLILDLLKDDNTESNLSIIL